MPNGRPDDEPVSWGRYSSEQHALDERVIRLESMADDLADAEAVHKQLASQITQLDEQMDRWRERSWSLVMTVLASLALPVLVLIASIGIHHVG